LRGKSRRERKREREKERKREREKERMRERGERVRDSVLLEKGFGIRHKFDRWSNLSKVRGS
jgi:hypothetical protein